MQRFFFSGAAESELDKQGRVGLPPRVAADDRPAGECAARAEGRVEHVPVVEMGPAVVVRGEAILRLRV